MDRSQATILGLVATVCMLSYLLLTTQLEWPPVETKCTDDALTKNAVFQAAATIMALTVFGSVFGVRIYQQVDMVRKGAKIILLLSIMSMIIIQVWVMGTLFYHDVGFHPIHWLIFTAISLMVIVGCLVVLGWGRDSDKSP